MGLLGQVGGLVASTALTYWYRGNEPVAATAVGTGALLGNVAGETIAAKATQTFAYLGALCPAWQCRALASGVALVGTDLVVFGPNNHVSRFVDFINASGPTTYVSQDPTNPTATIFATPSQAPQKFPPPSSVRIDQQLLDHRTEPMTTYPANDPSMHIFRAEKTPEDTVLIPANGETLLNHPRLDQPVGKYNERTRRVVLYPTSGGLPLDERFSRLVPEWPAPPGEWGIPSDGVPVSIIHVVPPSFSANPKIRDSQLADVQPVVDAYEAALEAGASKGELAAIREKFRDTGIGRIADRIFSEPKGIAVEETLVDGRTRVAKIWFTGIGGARSFVALTSGQGRAEETSVPDVEADVALGTQASADQRVAKEKPWRALMDLIFSRMRWRI